MLGTLQEEDRRSDEEFLTAFHNKYSDSLPPSWMMMEITSFGTLSSMFSNLNPGKTKREIANHFGLNEKVFASWIHSIVYLRNVCAHHSRLWNRVMSIQPVVPYSPKKMWLKNADFRNDKCYFMLCIILYFLQTINPNNSFGLRFKELIKEYSNIDVMAMGFPNDWTNEQLWS